MHYRGVYAMYMQEFHFHYMRRTAQSEHLFYFCACHAGIPGVLRVGVVVGCMCILCVGVVGDRGSIAGE